MNRFPIFLPELDMKTVPFRTIEVLLSVAILTTAVHLLLILYFAGYSLSLSFMTIEAQKVNPPAILLMALILAYIALRCRASTGMLLPGLFQLWHNYAYLSNPVVQPYGIFFGQFPVGGAWWDSPQPRPWTVRLFSYPPMLFPRRGPRLA